MAKIRGTAVVAGLSGSAGSVVFVRLPGGGTAIRERTWPTNPRSPAQQQWRALVARASALWGTLTPEQAELWREYAERIGDRGRPNASGLFVGLTAKVWQVDPLAAPPLTPPVQDFLGDGVTVQVEALAGAVRYTSSGQNSTGIVTELLLQALPSRLATPQTGRDRHKAFVHFEPGSLTADVPTTTGAYATSVRFVRAATGQASEHVRCGTVLVV